MNDYNFVHDLLTIRLWPIDKCSLHVNVENIKRKNNEIYLKLLSSILFIRFLLTKKRKTRTIRAKIGYMKLNRCDRRA